MGSPSKSAPSFYHSGGPGKKETSSTIVFGGLALLAILAAFFVLDPLSPPQEEEAAAVAATVEAQATAAVAATATALADACFITPLAQNSSVGVRKAPEVTETNLIRALYRGDQLQAIGHNGRTMNVDRWWLVELGEDEYAWVNSSVVEEITEASCARLEQVPGS